ncbi:hypothetical protein AURDEDRAFT_159606 [Auricularia subglabra TFB-10046 SS5]|nr:hypothetical protein AURDEDRAFT_159606 [Auricularia subglabra TFB-10046 SS5]
MTVPSSETTVASSQSRPASEDPVISLDTIHTPFPPFNPASVSVPYDDDARGLAQYETGVQGSLAVPAMPIPCSDITRALLETTLAFHAWACARPRAETRAVGDALSAEVRDVAAEEERQGMSSFELARQRLIEFVAKIKLAVMSLTTLEMPM